MPAEELDQAGCPAAHPAAEMLKEASVGTGSELALCHFNPADLFQFQSARAARSAVASDPHSTENPAVTWYN
jgi:hypothetical protein